MPIPDFQSIMLPLLKFTSDGKEHSIKETVEELSKLFNLTEEEKSEMLPSGVQPIFLNRVGWAKTYLKKASLLDSPQRGLFKISERGRKVLSDSPTYINIPFLRQFAEFLEFNQSHTTESDSGNVLTPSNNIQNEQKTPEELIESSYMEIRKSLSQEILTKVKSCSPEFFERLVVQLLVKMGYGGSLKDAGKAVGRSGDEGIDGIIKEDKLGLDVIYIQAKRWEGVVGRPEIHKFIGALAGQGARKGIFITTSKFTKEAREYAVRIDYKIVLIDGEELAQLMLDYNLGVSTLTTYELKRIDNDYFEEE